MLVILVLEERDEFGSKMHLALRMRWQRLALAVPRHVPAPPLV